MKKELGQFYTTNAKYITQDLLNFPKDVTVIDPFAGNWDLLNLLENDKIGYDIDVKNKETINRDTLLNPINYKNKWIITNPPYLARNKSNNKVLYNKYGLDDLYKIAVKTLIGSEGGLLILPINFFSSEDNVVRKEFLKQYEVKRVNVFLESVFNDTSYTVCSFFYKKKKSLLN